MCSHDLSYKYFLLCDFLLDMSICIQITKVCKEFRKKMVCNLQTKTSFGLKKLHIVLTNLQIVHSKK